ICAALVLAACSRSTTPEPDAPAAGRLDIDVQLDPFAIVVTQGDVPVLKSLTGTPPPVDPGSLPHLLDLDGLLNLSSLTDLNGFADLSARYGALGFALDLRAQAQLPLIAYGAFLAVPIRWFHATRAQPVGENRYRVETDDPLG